MQKTTKSKEMRYAKSPKVKGDETCKATESKEKIFCKRATKSKEMKLTKPLSLRRQTAYCLDFSSFSQLSFDLF